MEQNTPLVIIDALRNFELSVALMYETFGRVFPEEERIWQGLAEEEKQFARLLAGLKIYYRNRLVSFRETRITIQVIDREIGFALEQIDKARSGNLSLRDAVAAGKRIEESILENDLLRVFSFSSPKAKEAVMNLLRGTKNHREKLAFWLELLDKNRQAAV
ncbi:MAG: hypothetical protein Kow0089_24540 [Desulfobulbaceae bacterium]